MRIQLAAMAAVLAAASPARGSFWNAVDGDGSVTTEPRAVAAFTRISNLGSMDLEVTEGKPAAVSVTIDRNLQRHVRTEVQGDTLVVDTGQDVRPSGRAVVKVSLPALAGLELRGSGDARVRGSSIARDLALSTRGSGDVVYEGALGTLSVESSGSGNVSVTGPAGDVRAELRGSGELRYQGQARRVTVRALGSGDVRLSGSAESLEARTSGSGDIDARDLPVRDAVAITHGSGGVMLHLAGGRLQAETHGSGDVDWWGTGTLDRVRTSGSGSVEHRG